MTIAPSRTLLPAVLRRSRATGRVPAPYYWMTVPAVGLFVLFHTVPVISGVFYSFTDYAGYGEWNFAGLSNYINLFGDGRVLRAYGFSFLFAIVATVFTQAISLSIAMALNAKIVARNLFRGVFFIPYVLAI
jgi:raffinose/stachyose/melibiose transport system permease protein